MGKGHAASFLPPPLQNVDLVMQTFNMSGQRFDEVEGLIGEFDRILAYPRGFRFLPLVIFIV